jgi:2-polyprenyl-3-methyl-5-hydroxy-6-metoxy-1,4-benzoquinol methylase
MGSFLAHRSYQEEVMDDLNSSGSVIDQTLRELEIINRLLGGNAITIDGIKILLQQHVKGNSPITIADLGCGGGDILKLIARWGRKQGIPMKLTGIDANPNITAYATKNCNAYPEITFQSVNIFSEEFQKQPFDIIVATLFTHHFADDELVALLTSWKKQARIGFVINDLHRHWFAYYSIKWITRVFSKSPMVKNDAPLSVARAFLKSEWQRMLGEADIKGYSLRWRWAFRLSLVVPSSQIT